MNYRSAWCSNASNNSPLQRLVCINSWPLITSLKKQLSINGNLTSFSTEKETSSPGRKLDELELLLLLLAPVLLGKDWPVVEEVLLGEELEEFDRSGDCFNH